MNITIIGAGNMGGAIAYGLLRTTMVKAGEIMIAKFAPSKPDTRFKELGCHTTTDPKEACQEADLIIVAVKPWLVEHILRQIKPHVNKSIIASVAGGIELQKYEEHFSTAIFRVIPNTAARIGQSVTFIASVNATPEQKAMVNSVFKTIGEVVEIDESRMEACTALGSCGIAFAMRYIQASMMAGIEMGVSAEMAQRIVAQTMIGAANLAMEEGSHPVLEIEKVSTPGGITIKGLNEMEQCGFSNSVIRGLKASKR